MSSHTVPASQPLISETMTQPVGTHERRYMDVDGAALYLGISGSKLNKLRCYGGGPRYSKPGRRIVYDRIDLDNWLAAAKRNATAE